MVHLWPSLTSCFAKCPAWTIKPDLHSHTYPHADFFFFFYRFFCLFPCSCEFWINYELIHKKRKNEKTKLFIKLLLKRTGGNSGTGPFKGRHKITDCFLQDLKPEYGSNMGFTRFREEKALGKSHAVCQLCPAENKYCWKMTNMRNPSACCHPE